MSKDNYRKRELKKFGIWIGTLFHRNDMRGITDLEQRLAHLKNLIGKESDVDILIDAVIIGLPQLEKQYLETGVIVQPERGTAEYQDWAAWKKWIEITEKHNKQGWYLQLYENMGKEEFDAWAEEEGFDTTDFYRDYRANKMKSPQEKREEELRKLLSDHLPHKRQEIVAALQAKELIAPTKDKDQYRRDCNTLDGLASDLGFVDKANGWGIWLWKQNEDDELGKVITGTKF